MLDQQVLERDLYRATESLFITMTGRKVLTPADKPLIIEKIEAAMPAWDLEDIIVNMEDQTEFVLITVKYGRAEASVPIRWETPEGKIVVHIDTDGDGK